MKLTVLTDNNTIIDRYLLGEPALSFYLEDDGQQLLFDVGYSDVLIKNAQTLGIDLAQIPRIVISHGHDDHTRGLQALHRQGLLAGKTIIAHPDAFFPKFAEEQGHLLEIGSPYSADTLQKICTLQVSTQPLQLTEHVYFLGQIPRQIPFEPAAPNGFITPNAVLQPDFLWDDTALVYCGADGLSIITGCSHSGICNIAAYAQQLFQKQPIVRIIGGLHLLKQDERLTQTAAYLAALQLKEFHPCHCVSLAAKLTLSQWLPLGEVGSGHVLEWS